MDQRNPPIRGLPPPISGAYDLSYAHPNQPYEGNFPQVSEAPSAFPQPHQQLPYRPSSGASQLQALSSTYITTQGSHAFEQGTPPRRQSISQATLRRSSVTLGRKAPKKSAASNFTTACLNCRAKKTRCLLEEGGCKRCKKAGIQCPGPQVDERKVPSSKRHVRELLQHIQNLELALERSHQFPRAQNMYDIRGIAQFSPPESPISLLRKKVPNNIIARLCDGRSQYQYDSEGRLRYFGPTSSLHLTDTVTTSIVRTWGEQATKSSVGAYELDKKTKDYLLNLYWKSQHTELQILHRAAFIQDMENGETKFFSKALHYCMMACAARISNRPEIRAMVLTSGCTSDDQLPPLFAYASRLVNEELKDPQITTVQSLLLLSVIYCVFSQDTKGWVLTGTACRLALDLGLHRDCSAFSDRMSPMEMEARNIAFWGCVVFDRLWSLYLGRQYCLRLDGDVTAPRPSSLGYTVQTSLEAMLADAWSRLLEIVGFICEALNQNSCTRDRVNELGGRLQGWYNRLDACLQYRPNCLPSVCVMHMQYCGAIILLYRPLADFGIEPSERNRNSSQFRAICLKHAVDATQYMTDYRRIHGSATTLSGISLHIISLVATTLIADLSERQNADISHEFHCLIICVQTLQELEQTYLVAQQVRKVIEQVVRICNLNNHQLHMPSLLPEDFHVRTPFDATSSAGQTRSPIDENTQVHPNLDTNVLVQQFSGTSPDIPVSTKAFQVPGPPYASFTLNSFPLLDETQIPQHPATMSGDAHILYPCTQ